MGYYTDVGVQIANEHLEEYLSWERENWPYECREKKEYDDSTVFFYPSIYNINKIKDTPLKWCSNNLQDDEYYIIEDGEYGREEYGCPDEYHIWCGIMFE